MKTRVPVYLYGCGVTARAVHAYFKKDPNFSIEAFVVDEEYYEEKIIDGLPVLCFQHLNNSAQKTHSFAVCVGYSKLNLDRELIHKKLVTDGWSITSLVDSNLKSLSINIGEGTIIMPGANIQPFCNVGKCAIIWPGAIIGHDTEIEDYCWLTAGSAIGGNALIGRSTFVGINATVADNVRVGKYNLLGGHVFVSKCTNNNEVFLQESTSVARMQAKHFVKFTKFGE